MSDQSVKPDPLQIERAMADLSKATEDNAAAVRELLRRLEPVKVSSAIMTGTLCVNTGIGTIATNTGGFVITSGRAPLALSIDEKRMAINNLTQEVTAAIRALQI